MALVVFRHSCCSSASIASSKGSNLGDDIHSWAEIEGRVLGGDKGTVASLGGPGGIIRWDFRSNRRSCQEVFKDVVCNGSVCKTASQCKITGITNSYSSIYTAAPPTHSIGYI